MKVATGSYTGNGTSQSITGIGFLPDAVFIKDTSTHEMYLAVTGLSAPSSKGISTGTLSTTAITSRDSNGFSVGADANVNANANTYHYICLFDDGIGDIKFGTYSGNSTDNRNITGVGFQPSILMISGVTVGHDGNLYFKTASLAGDAAFRFAGTATVQANEIQSLAADGFQVGGDDGTNGTGGTYIYIAIKAVAGLIEEGSYVGNGSDNRDITLSGAFQPKWVLIKKTSSEGVHKPASLAGDAAMYGAATADASNRIQAINSTGFQVGTDTEVNTATGSPTYYWIALLGTTSTAYTKDLTETATFTDAVSHTASYIRSLTEVSTFVDTRKTDIVRSLVELSTALDTLSVGKGNTLSLVETATFLDSLAFSGIWISRTIPTTNWTDRTKPTDVWTDRTPPTTPWT